MKHLALPQALTVALFGAASLAGALPALGHHSFAAYERIKTVTLNGTVMTIDWNNPHVAFGMMVKPENSTQPQEWRIVTSGPSALARFGWSRDSIKPGERISIVCNPLSDGSLAGRLHTLVKLDTGETLQTKLSALEPDLK